MASLRTFGLSSRNCVLTMNSTMDAKHLSHGESSMSRTLIRRSLERLDREMASLNHMLLNCRFFRYCVEQQLGRKGKKRYRIIFVHSIMICLINSIFFFASLHKITMYHAAILNKYNKVCFLKEIFESIIVVVFFNVFSSKKH